MKLSNNNIIKRNFISLILILGFILLFVYWNVIFSDRNKNLEKGEVLYTAGVITFLEQGKGGPWFNYRFVVNTNSYSSRTIIGELSKEKKQKLNVYIGRKYFVKFSINKPQYSEIYLNKPVPKDFIYTEGQTWKSIPISYGQTSN